MAIKLTHTCLTYADLHPSGTHVGERYGSKEAVWGLSPAEYIDYRVMSDPEAAYGWWNLELDFDTVPAWSSDDDLTAGPRLIFPAGGRVEVYRPYVFGALPTNVAKDHHFFVRVRVHPVMSMRRLDSRTAWPMLILAVRMHTSKTLSVLAKAPVRTSKDLSAWQGTVTVSVTYGVSGETSEASAYYNTDMGFTHGLGKRL